MNVQLRKWHTSVSTVVVIAVFAVLFALATVTSNAADVEKVQDGQGNWTYTMSDSTYGEQINLGAGTTTTIKISGNNELTFNGPCINGSGNLVITGDGTLKLSNAFMSCKDFTINNKAKLIVTLMPGLNAWGKVTVDNADIKSPSMSFGSGTGSDKSVFNNARLQTTTMPGLMLYKDAVMTGCDVTITGGWIRTVPPSANEKVSVTIDGGTYNITQVTPGPNASNPNMSEAMQIDKAIIKDAVIKANSDCVFEDLEMTGTDLEITISPATDGEDTVQGPALSGNNAVISGSKLNIVGSTFAGISFSNNLTITKNTEANIQSRYFGILGENVQIIHSGGTIQATDPKAIAAVAAMKGQSQNSSETAGTLTLKAVDVTQPVGGKAGKVKTDVNLSPQSQSTEVMIATITDGNAPAKSVVLESGHDWDAGRVTKQPTASAEGVKTYTCTICGETKTEPIPKISPEQQMGADGTAFGPGASSVAAEKAILALKSDSDPKGTAFGLLRLKASKTTKTSVKLTWKKVSGAKKYVLYANKCGKSNKYKKLKVLSKNSLTVKKVAGKKLKKGTYYKFILVALDKNNNVLSTSKTVHAATTGGKVGNSKKVTTKAKKNKVTVKVKKTFSLKAKAVPASKKLKVKKHRVIKYETSNAKIATVSSKGAIKGVKKGTCNVYAYAQNGVCAVIKVTVK